MGEYLCILNLCNNIAFKDVNSVVNTANRSISYTCHGTTLSVTVRAAAWRGKARAAISSYKQKAPADLFTYKHRKKCSFWLCSSFSKNYEVPASRFTCNWINLV